MSKERLEVIKEHKAMFTGFKTIGNKSVSQTVVLDVEDYKFIIQQAEEKIQLEERVEKLEDELYELNESAIEIQNDFLDTNGEKNRLLGQNQRYKQVLEKIVNHSGINKEIDLELWKEAKKVLEADTQ